jgi:hypothetical protein
MKLLARAWRSAFIAFLTICAVCTLTLTACGGSGPLPPLDLQATGIKTLRLRWEDAPSATSFQWFVQEAGAPSPEVVATLPAHTTAHERQWLLPAQWGARHWLRTCRGSVCTDSLSLTVDSRVLDAAVGYFKAPNQGNRAGSSVALSADGQTLVVGVPRDDSATADPADTSASASGAVLVFVRRAGQWGLDAYLKASTPIADDLFGSTVAVSAAGTRVVVGAPQALNGVGAVFTYDSGPAGWTAQPAVLPANLTQAWHFGGAVALSADGQALAAGMTPELGQTSLTSSVDLFTQAGGQWSARQTLSAPDTTLDNGFGSALALSGDGQTLVVGASQVPRTIGGNTLDAGAAYVFARQGGGWGQTAELMSSNLDLGDRFGQAVAVSADGSTVAVGAVGETSLATGIGGDQSHHPNQFLMGAVYVFGRTGSAWTQQAYVKATNTQPYAEFGHAVSLSADGDRLAVAAVAQSGIGRGIGATPEPTGREESGAVYLYQRRAGAWQSGAYIKAPNADAGDRFGAGLALSGDGASLAVGAPNEDSASTLLGGDPADNSAPGSGAVYLY